VSRRIPFRGSTTSWIPRAIYQVISNDPDQVNQDLDSVYAWLETSPMWMRRTSRWRVSVMAGALP